MKQLLLIRHGKSDWDHPGLTDHDRPLNERGLRDAPHMAAALMQRGVKPDLIVSSTAVRAATTARMIAGAMGYSSEDILEVPGLYLAPPAVILRIVQQLDESAGTVMIFGHNPGMHEAVNAFSGDGDVTDFPTLAVARLEFGEEHWGLVEWTAAQLVELIMPRHLATG
jgi:phosphohistidine phosphatase